MLYSRNAAHAQYERHFGFSCCRGGNGLWFWASYRCIVCGIYGCTPASPWLLCCPKNSRSRLGKNASLDLLANYRHQPCSSICYCCAAFLGSCLKNSYLWTLCRCNLVFGGRRTSAPWSPTLHQTRKAAPYRWQRKIGHAPQPAPRNTKKVRKKLTTINM